MNGGDDDVMTLSEQSVLLLKDGEKQGRRQQNEGIAATLSFTV